VAGQTGLQGQTGVGVGSSSTYGELLYYPGGGDRGRRSGVWFKIADSTAGSVSGVTADTANSRLTVNAGNDGTFFLSGWAYVGGAASNGTISIQIYKDGTAQAKTNYYSGMQNWVGGSAGCQGPVTAILPINAGSYVELWAVFGGGDYTGAVSSGNFSMFKL
jgi:hypothetical protein